MKEFVVRIVMLTVVVLSAFYGHAAVVFEYGGIYYEIVDDEAQVCRNSDTEYSGDIVIPSHVSYEGKEYPVTAICDKAFEECDNLTSIVFPNTLRTIGDYSFFYCNGLTEITIPGSVEMVGRAAFCRCDKVASITFEASDKALFPPVGVDPYWTDQIGSYSMDNLRTIITERNVYTGYIEQAHDHTYFKHLLGFYFVTDIIIPDGSDVGDFLCSPDYDSLYGCSIAFHIENLTIGRDVKDFPTSMTQFTRLKTLTLGDEVPPPCPEFRDYKYGKIALIVPEGAVEAYRNAEGWKNFLSISGLNESVTSAERTVTGCYDLSGRRVGNDYRGVVITRYSDGTTKKTLRQ